MKPLPHLTAPRLLLLALVALLLFGNCGGGVHHVLWDLDDRGRTRLRAILEQERAERAAARQHLRGRARREAYDRTEAKTNAHLDSLMDSDFEQKKLQHRRNKLERQLYHWPVAAPQSAPAP